MSDTAISPAPPEPSTTAPVGTVALKDLSETQYNTWVQTGDVPTLAAEPAEPEAPAGTLPEGPAVDGSLPSSEPPDEPVATKKAKANDPRFSAQARFKELTTERDHERALRQQAEARAADLEARVPAAPPRPTPAAQPAPADDPEPQFDDFLDTTKYPDAYQAHAKASAKWEARQAIRTYQAQQAQQAQAAAFGTLVRDTLTATKTAHADFDPAPLDTISISASLARLIYEHPRSADLLYHFSKFPAEGRALAAVGEIHAAATIGELGARFAAPSSGGSSPSATPPVLPDPPPTFLGSKPRAGVVDELADAMAARDVDRFIELENLKELADRKAGRR